ncbi:MAG: redoxin domain-containing protein [Actinomycetota bacterium]|nr:redoxin domain-containing protein [Actinomycetota bacterium]
MPALGLPVGTTAPDFLLADHRGGKVQLSSFRGKSAVLLVFFPYAFTNVCSSEFTALSAHVKKLHLRGVEILGISCDSPYALAEFALRNEIGIDLLSDHWPHGNVCREYEVFLEDKGFAMRASFLIDQQGHIVWTLLQGPAEQRDPAAYDAAVDALA